MPTVAQLVDALTEMTGERRARVNMMARRLIDDGLMPRSRGRDIAQVDAESVVNLLFAVAFAEKGADAARTAREWGDLKWVSEDDSFLKAVMKVYGFSSEINFREALTSILISNNNTPMEISFLSIGPEGKLGKIECFVEGKQIFENAPQVVVRAELDEKFELNAHVDVTIEFSNYGPHYGYLFSRAYLLNYESIFALHNFLGNRDFNAPYISKPTPKSETDND